MQSYCQNGNTLIKGCRMRRCAVQHADDVRLAERSRQHASGSGAAWVGILLGTSVQSCWLETPLSVCSGEEVSVVQGAENQRSPCGYCDTCCSSPERSTRAINPTLSQHRPYRWDHVLIFCHGDGTSAWVRVYASSCDLVILLNTVGCQHRTRPFVSQCCEHGLVRFQFRSVCATATGLPVHVFRLYEGRQTTRGLVAATKPPLGYSLCVSHLQGHTNSVHYF